ncbi:acyl-CoA N-acyltransferase [Pilobolus umbonatus]|nr:acyl-CoA N-acyltransferase [Pilobolus umbonatus]
MEVENQGHPVIVKHPQLTPWITNANEALVFSLVQPHDHTQPSFSPEYTYQLFGEHESIFGYKDLQIKILYSSGSLYPCLQIDYSAKYTDTTLSDEVVKADDIGDALKEHLSPQLTTNYDSFVSTVEKDAYSFKPRGEKIHEYTLNEEGKDCCYEIYKSSFSDLKFRDYHQRMQLFALVFIDGSSYIDDTDVKWEIYTVYKKEGRNDSTIYHFIGYSTVYPFYCWPDKIRMRISQFLILPPYRKRGHGSMLYQKIYAMFKIRDEVTEITVEDPSEEFSDMRDRNDYRYLSKHHAFDGLKSPVPLSAYQAIGKEYKLTRRQVCRCIELYLLSRLNKMNVVDYKAYRIEVKRRLFEFNYDVLKDLPEDDRKDKIDETYNNVEEDYHRILEMI